MKRRFWIWVPVDPMHQPVSFPTPLSPPLVPAPRSYGISAPNGASPPVPPVWQSLRLRNRVYRPGRKHRPAPMTGMCFPMVDPATQRPRAISTKPATRWCSDFGQVDVVVREPRIELTKAFAVAACRCRRYPHGDRNRRQHRHRDGLQPAGTRRPDRPQPDLHGHCGRQQSTGHHRHHHPGRQSADLQLESTQRHRPRRYHQFHL